MVPTALAWLLATAPVVEVYTMGPGSDLFSHFGHAAICVGEPEADRCYNFGTADFSTPLPLTFHFLRGRAEFWVEAGARGSMINAYQRADRSVTRLSLSLAPEAATAIAEGLERMASGDERFYRYHHFADNCTTRIRDVLAPFLPAWADPALHRPTERSYRQDVRAGFARSLPLLAATDLLLGRPVDRYPTRHEAMYLPAAFEQELVRAGATRTVIYARQKPLPAPFVQADRVGAFALALVLFGVALLGRFGLAAGVCLLGVLGVFCFGIAGLSLFAELAENEALLLFWPSDLLYPFLGRFQGRYRRLRTTAIGLGAALWAGGVFVQPLLPLLLVAGAPWLGAAFRNSRPPQSESSTPLR